MSNRPREYNRTKSYWKAKRKRDIDRNRDPQWYDDGGGFYNNLHQYSKNKIHCSCPMCSAKTRNKGANRCFGYVINWKKSDKKKIDSMKYQLDEISEDDSDEEV